MSSALFVVLFFYCGYHCWQCFSVFFFFFHSVSFPPLSFFNNERWRQYVQRIPLPIPSNRVCTHGKCKVILITTPLTVSNINSSVRKTHTSIAIFGTEFLKIMLSMWLVRRTFVLYLVFVSCRKKTETLFFQQRTLHLESYHRHSPVDTHLSPKILDRIKRHFSQQVHDQRPEDQQLFSSP